MRHRSSPCAVKVDELRFRECRPPRYREYRFDAMLALATVFIVVVVSLLITRVATVALTLTGMSRESARFQARSALSGVGFTTAEAEGVVNHPVRRRVVLVLMVVGSAGIVTAIATLMLSFTDANKPETFRRLLILIAGLLLILAIARSSWVDRRLSRLIGIVLNRWTDLDARDYARLLHLSEDHAVMEIAVREGDWVAGRTLEEAALREEGVAILGIDRSDGTYLGAPLWSTKIRAGDTLIVYGAADSVRAVDRRPAGAAGDRAHEDAVAGHRRRLEADHQAAGAP